MIIQADILEWSERYDGEPFHAALMDAPYHLAEITRRFGKAGSAEAQYGTDGAFQRASRGFMGKQWDGGDIAFRPETWDAIARHLHPGGWIVSFGGSRTWHRMACAMEDAGLIIQPTMFLWAYGSGFPKATRPDAHIDARAFRDWLDEHPKERELLAVMKRAGKRDPIDKKAAQGYERELKQRAGLAPQIVGQKKHAPKFDAVGHGYREKDNGYNSKDRKSFDLTAPATDLARDWAGHRYGGQAIKPAVEPIIFAQKPYDGAPVESMVRTGAGALWIDGARIGTDEDCSRTPTPNDGVVGSDFGIRAAMGGTGHPGGRWPANLVLSHLPDCNGTCAPGCAGAALGRQSGEREGSDHVRGNRASIGYGGSDAAFTTHGHDDTGTAARFFYNADWQYERLEQADPVGYFAKASKGEREAGLDDMQVRLMRDLYGVDDDFEDELEEHESSGAKFTGFDSTEIVVVKLTHNCQAISEGEPWVSAGLEVQLQVVMDTSRPRVIGVSETQKQNVSAWSMFLFGSETTAPFLTGIKSTIVTKISSTTESKILNWLTRLLTNESTAVASFDQTDGGSHVGSAERLSPSLSFTNDEMVSLPGVGNVPSGTLWTISASAKLETNPFSVLTINDGRKTPIDNAYQRGETSRRNVHPCVKPIALNRWLATLLLPPARYAPRRLLIPFAGVASEYIGALLAGWEEIVGVELEAQHVKIAQARIAYWEQLRYRLMNPDTPIKLRPGAKVPDGQLELF